MKKKLLVIIFGLTIIAYAHAQSTPVMGYEQVEWGASVEDVRRAFDLGEDVPLEENPSYIGGHYLSYNLNNHAVLWQKYVSEGVLLTRHFVFNNLKNGEYQLYRVVVGFMIHSEDEDAYNDAYNIVKNWLDMLADMFGDITKQFYCDVISFGFKGRSPKTFEFGKRSPELLVELLHVDSYNFEAVRMSSHHTIEIRYTWESFNQKFGPRLSRCFCSDRDNRFLHDRH